MVQTLNFINLSSQQAPNDVDWAGLVNSGVQGVLIRLGHGIIRDPCARGHIAKAKQYGLYWHGYHTYEGVVNEPQFTIKNATELGLSTSQYYFVDLTKSSDPFNDYYALHATWLSQGYSTGLLISNEDYLSKFTDSEVTASGSLRWLISDTEPANYDIWQYSSEGTIGTSSVKIGFNFAKTDKLKYNLSTTLTGADISKDPYNPQAPVGGAYIGWGYDTTGLGGGKTFGYSTNGKNFYALVGPRGLVVRKSDGNRIYGTIADQIDSAISANVIPAKSAADSAQSAADAAIASAQVTSDAVSAIASATAEAKQGANDAMSRAKSAWDVATGAKEAVTDFDPLIKSAQSDASKALVQIADTASALSDAKTAFSSDVAVAKNLANAAQTTADSAVKSASSVADDLSVVASQAKANANGITKVTSDVGLLQTTVANNTGDISTIQATAKQIQQAVSDNAGNITVAKQTAQGAVTVASDARSNATVATQTASQASVTAKDASSHAASAVITANGAMTTASNAKSEATVAIQTASGASLTATNAKSDATVAKQTASEASLTASNAKSDFAQLSIRANKIEANVANNSGAIASVQQTANGLTTTVGKVDDRVKKIEDTTNWTTKGGPLDMNTLTTTQNIYYRDTNLKNADGETGWAYIQVVSIGERVTQTVWHDRSSIQHTRTGALNSPNSNYNWDAWNEVATYAQVVEVKKTIDGIATTINDPKIGLNATYQTAAGNSNTISNVKSDVYQLQTTASGLTSRVGNLESKTSTQETAIEQYKNAIKLKADQIDVDTLKGSVKGLQAESTTQANEIKNKVTRSDVTGMLTGYATQEYAQGLVTLKADEWNLNLTTLKTDVNAIKTTGGGVNLVSGTDQEYVMGYEIPNTVWQDGYAYEKLPTTSTMGGEILPQGSHTFWYTLTQGTTYTQTIWFETDANFTNSSSAQITWYNWKVGHDWQPATLAKLGENKYKLYSTYTWPGKSDNGVRLFDICHLNDTFDLSTGTYLKFGKLMLEEGTVSHSWSPAPSDMATVTSVTNLSATVDGIKGLVKTKADQSEFTQLSNLVQSKVSSGDFTSTTTQLKNLINQRVQVGDVISQINQEAGGDTLIQVSNGKKSLILDAGNTIVTGKAWIPVAAIANLTADQVQAGTLKGVKVDFRDSTGTGMIADGSTLTFDVSNTPAGYLSYNGMPVAELPDGSGGNELAIRYRLSTSIIPDDSSGAQATFSKAAQKIAYMTGTSQGKQMLSGLEVHANNHHWLGAVNSDATYNRIEINSNEGVNLTWHDNTHFWISDGNAKLYKDYNDSQTATKLEIHGWAWVNGWVEAAGHSQHSALSTKTALQAIDDNEMLEMVNNTDLASFLFKTDVASGETHRHIGLIIDDVHDVAHYQAPQDFIAPNGVSRDDDNMIGALFGAVKALTKRIKTLESKVG